MIFRLVCKNGLIYKDFSQKKRHIGRQVETYDTAYEIYSDETLAQDDKAFFMKVQDIVRTTVGENKFMMTVNRLQEAMEFPLEHNPMEDRVNLNVETWVNEWLETVKLNIRPRTYEKYKSCLIGYIVPKYKERKLKDLNMQSLRKQ